MQSDITQKQSYLYKEIIEGGYNAQQFQQYLHSKHQSADDLSVFQFSQLKKIVNEFKQNQNKKKTAIVQTKQQKQQLPKPQQTIKIQSSSAVIKCQLAPPTFFTQLKQIHIEVVKFQKKQGGIFEKAYVDYIIYTPCLKSTVQRRYTDFQWLRNTLQLLHPGIPLPPIPKKGHVRRYDDKHLMKRTLMLQLFLNKLTYLPDIKTDKIFQTFLKSSKNQFQNLKNQYKNLTQTPLIKIKNNKGQLNLSLQKNHIQFVSKYQQYLIAIQPDVKKVYKQFKGSAFNLQSSSLHLHNISNICKDLNSKLYKFSKQNNSSYFSTNLFSLFQVVTQKYSNLLSQQANTFRKQIYSTFKFQSLSMISMIQSLEKLAVIQQQYQQNLISLQKRKQKLYQQGNTVKWGNSIAKWKQTQRIQTPQKQRAMQIMLPKQTSQLVRMKQRYGLFNSQIYQQINRSQMKNNQFISRKLSQLCNIQSRISSQNMMLWADVQIKISQLKQCKVYKNPQMIQKKT